MENIKQFTNSLRNYLKKEYQTKKISLITKNIEEESGKYQYGLKFKKSLCKSLPENENDLRADIKHFSEKKVLEATISQGARMAEPGEFTKRAFLNGRIDLSQAEAVIDLIQAKTEKSLIFFLFKFLSLNNFWAISKAFGPLTLTIPIPLSPREVEIAAIVSFSQNFINALLNYSIVNSY